MPRRTKTQALGQHFLADRKVLDRIIDAADIGSDEVVCEAGTGNGVLTQELCKRARQVLSYEVDKILFQRSTQSLRFPNLQMVNADLFKVRRRDIKFDVFCSNLPYSKSRDALQWLATKKFDRAIVMVQQEFADKLAARPGSENYRAISAICSHCFKIEQLFAVSPEAFEPPPKVNSAVLRLIPVNAATTSFITKINRLFSQRNKRASSVAAKMGATINFGNLRVDQLEPGQLAMLAGLIK
ncbi:MAG: 16S rRNA (adenine(1518)-N(6)/adenine(1519)-N(6))-dimethyltransferase RsmA [Nitrososphaera sp.]